MVGVDLVCCLSENAIAISSRDRVWAQQRQHSCESKFRDLERERKCDTYINVE